MRSSLVAVLLVLVGCGGDAPEDSGEAGTGAVAPVAAPAGADAVNAVQLSAGTPVARLQFVIETRPEVGQPFLVKLVATAPEAVPALQVVAESAELSLENPAGLLVLDSAGASGTHELTATATQEGLTEIHVKLRGDAAQAEAVYSIPVLISAAAAG